MTATRTQRDGGWPVSISAEPWRELPDGAAVWLRAHLAAVEQYMIDGVLREVPEYARPGDPQYRQVVEAAVGFAMEHFVRLIDDPETSWDDVHKVYFDVGYGEAVEGRSLEHFQNAMRIASRLAWRYLSTEYEREGRPLEFLSAMAEANFAYLDELSSAAADGYARAREKAAGEREQRRARLLSLLLSDAPVPPNVIAEQAAVAGWRLPRRLAVVVLQPWPGNGGEGPAGLPPEMLVGLDQGRPCIVVPDPEGPGQVDRLAGTLAGWTAAAGPTVAPEEARMSLHWARRALDLAPGPRETGRPRPGRLIRAEEHLPELLIQEGGPLVDVVAARRLAPLQLRNRSKKGLSLAVTLLECLKNGFNATDAAVALNVHPQTVRYRMAQLTEMFDFDIEDPEIRLELMLLLRAWIRQAREDADTVG
ncbi:helix-turn-helix domain-containing protein [Actinomadura rayongensis]|uniref:PucR family transcriptional regulator n=1 Tax=Actinomadura rayongensis TaxID=1429076 RepID=A0A6I4WGU4_9ACTN|nr:PucR family transcriptional regulator [Actinomadura rayongensis]